MADLRTRYQIDLEGNLDRQARRFGRSIDRMSTRSQRALGGMKRGFATVGNVAERSLNRYSGIVTGAAGFAVGRFLTGFERRLTSLQNANDLTEQSVESLRAKLFETASDQQINIPVEELLSAVEGVVEMTGDLDFARENMRGIALAIQSAGAEGKAIGDVVAEIQKLGVTDPSVTLQILDTLIEQGKSGSFTLKNLASLGPRVITAYSSMVNGGRDAVTQMRELGATLQTVRAGTGNAEQAATAFEAVLRTLSDPKKLEMLREGGLQIFDPAGLKEGKEQLRPINEVMLEIQRATGGRRTLLGQVFDAEAIRAFNAMKPENVEKFYAAVGKGESMTRDAARKANDMAGALDRLNNAWKSVSSGKAGGVFSEIAEAINSIDKETLEKLIEWGVIGAAGFGAMGVLAKSIKWGGTIAGAGKKAIGRGGAAGAISSTTGVTPVYVVNMPGAKGMPGMGGGAGGGKPRPAPRRPGRFSLLRRTPLGAIGALGAGAVGTAGLAVGGAAAGGAAVGTGVNKAFLDGTSAGERIGRQVAEFLALFGNDQAQRSIEMMDRAAERMERAAEKMDGAESVLKLELDERGRVRFRGLQSRNRDVDMAAGPMRAGSD